MGWCWGAPGGSAVKFRHTDLNPVSSTQRVALRGPLLRLESYTNRSYFLSDHASVAVLADVTGHRDPWVCGGWHTLLPHSLCFHMKEVLQGNSPALSQTLRRNGLDTLNGYFGKRHGYNQFSPLSPFSNPPGVKKGACWSSFSSMRLKNVPGRGGDRENEGGGWTCPHCQ